MASDERSYAEKAQDRRNERSLRKSADSAKDTAKSVKDMLKLTEAQLKLTRAQLALSESARADAEQAERFTRWMSWSSLAIAAASLGAAVTALVFQ